MAAILSRGRWVKAHGHYVNQCWHVINKKVEITSDLSHNQKMINLSKNSFLSQPKWVKDRVQFPCCFGNPYKIINCYFSFVSTASLRLLYPRTTKLLGGILVSLRPSVRPSRIPCPLCNTYSSGWIFSYSHILSSNFRRCDLGKVSCKISIFEFLTFFFKFVTLTLSCFDLGSDVNH